MVTRFDRCWLAGFTNDSCPVFLETVDFKRAREMLASVKSDDLLALAKQQMEFMSRVILPFASKRAGKPVRRIVTVLDCRGASISSINKTLIDLFVRVASMTRNHYPELVSKAYLINPPKGLSALLKVLSPAIPPATRAKLLILHGGADMVSSLKSALGPHFHMPSSVLLGHKSAQLAASDAAVVSLTTCCVEYIADHGLRSEDAAAPGACRTHAVLSSLFGDDARVSSAQLPRRATFTRVPASNKLTRTLSTVTVYHDCEDVTLDEDAERDAWYATRALNWSEAACIAEQAEQVVEVAEAPAEGAPKRRRAFSLCFGSAEADEA